LDLAPTCCLVVAGAGAGTGTGTTSTDWLRFLPPRCGPFVVSASWSRFASRSGLAAGVVGAAAFVPRAVLHSDLMGSVTSFSTSVIVENTFLYFFILFLLFLYFFLLFYKKVKKVRFFEFFISTFFNFL
jgi:hypothetical protein